MLGFNHWHLFRLISAAFCIVGMSWLALAYFIPEPPSEFTIATGAKNQTYEAIGKRYQEILARSHVDVELRLTNGAVDNIKLLNDPSSGIKVGIAQGGISDGERSPDLLSLGRINYQIYWIFHRAAEPLNDLRQLKGKRIVVGPQGSGQRVTTERILGIQRRQLRELDAPQSLNAKRRRRTERRPGRCSVSAHCPRCAHSPVPAEQSPSSAHELHRGGGHHPHFSISCSVGVAAGRH